MRRNILLFASAALTLSFPPQTPGQHQHPKAPEAGAKSAAKISRLAPKPAEGASIKIVSPTKGQIFKSDKVPVHFKLIKGKRGHHAHAYVDGELIGMFESEKGTLNGVKPGKRVLELRVVASDHETELDASDKVEFTVK